jgi:hypothetical protein
MLTEKESGASETDIKEGSVAIPIATSASFHANIRPRIEPITMVEIHSTILISNSM